MSGCAIDFCPTFNYGNFIGSVLIPPGVLTKIFKNQPCNFSPAQIQQQIAKGEDGRRVCTMHVRTNATGPNGEDFELHNLQSDPIYDLIIKGIISPQPGYLMRMQMSEEDFIRDVKRRKIDNTYDAGTAIATETTLEEKYITLLEEKKKLSQQLNGMSGQVTKKSNVIATLTNRLDAALAEIKDMKAEAQSSFWTSDSVLQMAERDVLEITGLDKKGWHCWIDFAEALGAKKYWEAKGKKDIPWNDAMLLTQVKLRHNTHYQLLKKLFGYEKEIMGNYFLAMIVWEFEFASWGMSFDSTKEMNLRRISGYQRPFLDIPFDDITQILDLTLIPMENYENSQARAETFSNYKKGARAHVGASVDPSGEPVYVSCAYATTSDANLYKHGTTPASKFTPAKNLKDFLKVNDVLCADKGTLIQAWLSSLGLNATMVMPPFVVDHLISEEEKIQGKAIATRRYVMTSDRHYIFYTIISVSLWLT